MLTANQLVLQACKDAHVPAYLDDGQKKLQVILDEICFKHDFGLARGAYYFSLNPGNITTINGVQNFGGPYPLPLDYLRTSGSSGADGVQYAFFYVFDGVPYPMVPFDLGRMDMQVQQPGIQNFPYAYATDVAPETTAQDRIAGTTTCSLTAGSVTAFPFSQAKMQIGMSVSGYGISPGSTIANMSASAAPGTQTITLSLPAVATFTGTLQAGTAGSGSASIMFGTPVNAFVYPGPSGAFPTTLRYQRLMPPLLDFERVPWFPDQQFLLDRLTAEMMATSDDTRHDGFQVKAARRLAEYEVFSDDKTSRAQTVILDRQRWGGRRFSRLPHTKTIGWLVVTCVWLGGFVW